MTIPTLVTLSLSILALCASTCALYVALRSSDRYLSKRLSEHSTQLQELAESHEALTVALRNLRSRLNMQASRARKAQEPAEGSDAELPLAGPRPGLSAEEWKRRMNLQLATRGAPPR